MERLEFKILHCEVLQHLFLPILPPLEGFVTSVTTPGPGSSQMNEEVLPNEDPCKGRDYTTAGTELLKTPKEGAELQFILTGN